MRQYDSIHPFFTHLNRHFYDEVNARDPSILYDI
jgi:hypothetical protein